ncbi:MAG: DnaB-like helicase C-terminal domain-containing protein [Candidatus Binatia bacterium]
MPIGKDLASEADEIDGFLAELEGEEKIKEIAGLKSGFPGLDGLLNGILPGCHFLVGPPSCGKTSFAKQLCDQVAERNSAPVLFFTFAEGKQDLRIKTLARLSGLESREILRGRSFILHSYGVPKSHWTEADMLPPSWQKLRAAAEEAKTWLSYVYLFECGEQFNIGEIRTRIVEFVERSTAKETFVVIDDSQRLGPHNWAIEDRLPLVAEGLQSMAVETKLPLLAVWPDFSDGRDSQPHLWGEKIHAAQSVLVLRNDSARDETATEPWSPVSFYVVKNRGGEKGKIRFEFQPAVSAFKESLPATRKST